MPRFDGLVKSVAKELRSYYDIKRREENFDLSSSRIPAYDVEIFRFNRLFGYSNLTDKSMKHYFQKPGLMNTLKLEAESKIPKEKLIKDKLMNRLSKSASFNSCPKARSKSTVPDKKQLRPKTKPDFIPLGLLALRSCQTPYLTKGEKFRVVESTTKLIAVTDSLLNTIDTNKRKHQEIGVKSLERKEITKETANTNDQESQVSLCLQRPKTGRVRKPLLQVKSSESSNETGYSSNQVADEPKFTFIVSTKTRIRQCEKIEVPIFIQFFGSKGKSEFIQLNEEMSNKKPFNSGQIDKFKIESHNVGDFKAIAIGTNQQEPANFIWYLKKVQIYDDTNKTMYEFRCNYLIDSKTPLRALTLAKKKPYSDINSETNSSSSNKSSLVNIIKEEEEEALSREEQQVKSIFSESASTVSTIVSQKDANPQSENPPDSLKVLERGETFISPSIKSEESTDYKYTKTTNIINNTKTVESENEYASLSSQSKSKFSSGSERKEKTLIQAVLANDLELVKTILANSPELSLSTDENGQTLLLIACMKGYNELAKYLIDENSLLINIETPNGYSPIHYCVKYGKLECLKVLYENGCLINQQTNSGFTPIHLSALNGNLDITKYLIERGADLTIKDDLDRTPAELARKYGHNDLLKYFEDSINDKNANENIKKSMIDSLSDKSSDFSV